jgi:hypothetical protein
MSFDFPFVRLFGVRTILLYVCVLDTIYGLVAKKIAVGNLKKIIVTPKEDNLFLYIIIYGVTIITWRR